MDTILSNQECVTILKQVNDKVVFEHFEIVSASDDILGFLGEYFKLKMYTKDVSSSMQNIFIYLSNKSIIYRINIFNFS